jgi:hypothetical protein
MTDDADDTDDAWLARARALRAELRAQPEPLLLPWGDVIWDREIGSPHDRVHAKRLWIPRGLVGVDADGYAPPRLRTEDPHGAAAQAARLRMALVLDADSPDGWRLVDLVETP